MTTFTVEDDALPAPGEATEVDLGAGLVALIENTNEPADEADAADDSPPITYTAVETAGWSVVTHAAAVHQRSERTRVERFTLCDRQQSRVVKCRKRDLPLTAVTCTQCRQQLERIGVL